jgi:hypothetical protein
VIDASAPPRYASRVIRTFALVMLAFAVACQHSPRERRKEKEPEQRAVRPLRPTRTATIASVVTRKPTKTIETAAEAAAHAAEIANEECERVLEARPFSPGMWTAEKRGERWFWGRKDTAAPGGLSTEVSFEPDGANTRVNIYIITDWPAGS